MTSLFLPPLLAGLSVGVYCVTYCIPFIAPFMVSEERGRKRDFGVILKFIFGRFAGYILFGAAIGYLGAKVDNRILTLVLTISLILLSVFLILHAVGLTNPQRFTFCAGIKRYNPNFPFIMGFLMGANICPPFLMSLAYVFTLESAYKGVIYFLFFFIGTSIYFLPLFFLGYLNKYKEFQLVGRVAAILVGALFLIYGGYSIVTGGGYFHLR